MGKAEAEERWRGGGTVGLTHRGNIYFEMKAMPVDYAHYAVCILKQSSSVVNWRKTTDDE